MATSICSSPAMWISHAPSRSAATNAPSAARIAIRWPCRRCRTWCSGTTAGVFTDVSESTGIARYRSNGLGVVISDLDGNGFPDMFVANDSLPNYLFVNEGGWRFAEAALPQGVSVADDGKARAGMGTDTGDYDGDGLLDLIVTNHEFEMTSLYRNVGKRLFAYATRESGIAAPTRPYVGFGVLLLDYDNDTRLDIAIVNGHVMDNTASFRQGSSHAQPNLLMHNRTGATFARPGSFPRVAVRRTRSAGASPPRISTTTATWICS